MMFITVEGCNCNDRGQVGWMVKSVMKPGVLGKQDC